MKYKRLKDAKKEIMGRSCIEFGATINELSELLGKPDKKETECFWVIENPDNYIMSIWKTDEDGVDDNENTCFSIAFDAPTFYNDFMNELEKIQTTGLISEAEDFGFPDELYKIIEFYKDGSDEPLDGDEVDRLTEILRTKINLIEGNITDEEYGKKLNY